MVIAALRAVVGDAGTVVMPAQSWQLCDPAFLNEPHVPAQWWPAVRDALPLYEPALTPSQTMGAVAELFRTTPGAVRSPHPHRSFAAVGPRAAALMAVHDLDNPNGERSPLAALYDAGAVVLLLGVGFGKCTALHLAEHRADYPAKHTVTNGAPAMVDGQRTWVSWQEMAVEDGDFPAVGAAFEAEHGSVRRGTVGQAPSALLRMQDLVDHAVAWFTAHRATAADTARAW